MGTFPPCWSAQQMGGAFGDRVYGSESRPVLPTLARGAARGSLGQDEAPVCQPQASSPSPPRFPVVLFYSFKEKKGSILPPETFVLK